MFHYLHFKYTTLLSIAIQMADNPHIVSFCLKFRCELFIISKWMNCFFFYLLQDELELYIFIWYSQQNCPGRPHSMLIRIDFRHFLIIFSIFCLFFFFQANKLRTSIQVENLLPSKARIRRINMCAYTYQMCLEIPATTLQ